VENVHLENALPLRNLILTSPEGSDRLKAIAAAVVSGLVDSDRLRAIAALDVDAAGWIPAPAASTCVLWRDRWVDTGPSGVDVRPKARKRRPAAMGHRRSRRHRSLVSSLLLEGSDRL